ncbi:MAG: low molecular weight phosphotyrosine protein phosphatase [Anaerolineae bacterium]|nr:low molecular weight phosphotyrosine protein phosphatase [Anaerolineae bacterium]
MIRVLFVCLGNICRSPMADAVFQDMVKKAGLSDKIEVDSAGTGSWHIGESAHRGTLGVLKRHNIPYQGRARQIARADFDEFDYILPMDSSNLADIQRLVKDSDAEIAPFLSYANAAGTVVGETDVPDPYYDQRFDYVYELVEKGCAALLAHIRQQYQI